MAAIDCGRVRVVARIRGVETKPWILVTRSDPNGSSRVKVSFSSEHGASGKQSYEIDECYEQVVGNEELFGKEIKPLISGLFGGQNSTVFAYGTRGSGKTYTLQGAGEQFGMVALAMDSILPRAEEEQKVVNVSVFEVCQDRIMDLLDSKRSEVLVFEDAQGKIRLKGLSKVKVTSTEEFQRLYRNALNTRMQKAAEPTYRSHMGCVLHVVSPQTENSSAKLVGKINFVDLASYEDSRRTSSDGLNLTETTKIKKSLNAVHNVLYSLNAKERVPYRETKLTRMLQDSLGGSSRTLMVTCINPPFSQETAQTISVASRTCIAGFLANLDLGRSGRSAGKSNVKSSPQCMKSSSKLSTKPNLMSPKVLKPMSASASARKHTTSHLSVRKASGGAPLQKKGRTLFADKKQGTPSKVQTVLENGRLRAARPATSMNSSAQSEVKTVHENERLRAATSMDSSAQSEVKTVLENEHLRAATSMDSSSQSEENSTVNALSETNSSQVLSEKEKSASDAYSETDSSQVLSEKEPSDVYSDVNSYQLPLEEDIIQAENVTATPCGYKTPVQGSNFLGDNSPPLSARLRELSNSLKSMCVSNGSNLKKTQERSRLYNQVIHENLEPNTPTFQTSARTSEKQNRTNNGSPWKGVKNTIVQESLKILNSASKEQLKGLKGIGEKRATYILEMRDESPEPFKELDDLKVIGLSEKQIKVLVKEVAGNLFT